MSIAARKSFRRMRTYSGVGVGLGAFGVLGSSTGGAGFGAGVTVGDGAGFVGDGTGVGSGIG